MRTLILLSFVAVVCATSQYEGGFVKILQDKRYQSGATFGNFRDQEDGTKYFEETDEHGVRRGYWQYVDQDGKLIRNEFEAGAGIGFRITKSNINEPTPVFKPQPQFQSPARRPTAAPRYKPVQPQYQPAQPTYQPAQPTYKPVQPQYRPAPPPAPIPTPSWNHPTLQPEPQNLFDYPGNLEFSRSHLGHRFKFTAT